MLTTLGSLVALYVLREIFLYYPVLKWLGAKRLERYRNTATWLFARRPLVVVLVEKYYARFAPQAFSYDPTPWLLAPGDDANCISYVHAVPESGILRPGHYGGRQLDKRWARFLQRQFSRFPGEYRSVNRLRLGLYLDGLKRVTWWSLLRPQPRTLVVILMEPNTNQLHARRLDADCLWSEKFPHKLSARVLDRQEDCGLTGYRTVGFYWINHLDSAPRAHHEKEPRTRVRVARELVP